MAQAMTARPEAAAPRVVDVDWSLGVSASSSELQAIGSTFVVLRLHTEATDGTAQFVHLGKAHGALLFPMAFWRPAAARARL